MEAGCSRWHLLNKMFLLLLATKTHNLCGVYDIKTPFRLVIGLKTENVVFRQQNQSMEMTV